MPDALFWGDFSGDGEAEVLMLDDQRGLLCLRADGGGNERVGSFATCGP